MSGSGGSDSLRSMPVERDGHLDERVAPHVEELPIVTERAGSLALELLVRLESWPSLRRCDVSRNARSRRNLVG